MPRVAPDRTIRAWNAAADLERREEAKFNALAEHEKVTAAITAAVGVLKARLRSANDPRVEREYGIVIVGRDLLDASVRNFQLLPRAPLGECAVVYAHPGQLANLGRALSMLLPKTTKGVNDPKAPRGKGMKWWNYIRDMRKRTGERRRNVAAFPHPSPTRRRCGFRRARG